MNDSERKFQEGKESLHQKMDVLKRFLPKPDMQSPPPARKWKLEDNSSKPHKEVEIEIVQQF